MRIVYVFHKSQNKSTFVRNYIQYRILKITYHKRREKLIIIDKIKYKLPYGPRF